MSWAISAGEVFCLLGPNGAGKTTIVEILEGYRTRTGGQAAVLGIDPATGARRPREQVGIVLQQCGVQDDLTVAELVEMYRRYYVRRRPVDEVNELVELTQSRDVRAKVLSGGHPSSVRQKLDARKRVEAIRLAEERGLAVSRVSLIWRLSWSWCKVWR